MYNTSRVPQLAAASCVPRILPTKSGHTPILNKLEYSKPLPTANLKPTIGHAQRSGGLVPALPSPRLALAF